MATFSTNGFTITYNDHSPVVLAALKNAVNRGLKACGETAVQYAKENVPKKTGNLARHITYEVDDDTVKVGVSHMNPQYGIYVEYGTGKHATTGGRKTKWVYKAEDGHFYTTEGMKPRPFIKPAASEHKTEYRDILKRSLENA